MLAVLDAEGAPVVDHCRGTLAVTPAALDEGWASLVAGLAPGVTHLALHCTAAGDFSAMSPLHAPWRLAEHGLIARGRLDGLLADAGIAKVGTRALQTLWCNPASGQPAAG